MRTDGADDAPVAEPTSEVPLYPPSWVDRLQDALERGSRSPWAYYALAWALHFTIVTGIKWADGSYAVGTVFPYHGLGSAVAVLSLMLVHALDRSAEQALRTFRPLRVEDGAARARLGYRLTHLRRGPALAFTLVGVAIAGAQLVSIYSEPEVLTALKLGTSPAAFAIEIATYAAMWVALSMLVYHTVHQLRVVDRVMRWYTEVSLFQLESVYGFSRLTVRTAAGVVLLPYLMLGPSTAMTDVRVAWIVAPLLMTLIGAFTFAWPLWGAHRLLVDEKTRLLREAGSRVETVVQRIHASVDTYDLSDVDGLNKQLSSLMLERSMLETVSTWPWHPEAPRLLATAVVLPIVLFVVQRVLAGMLGI